MRDGLYLVDADTGATRAVALVNDRTPTPIGSFAWGADSRTLWFTRRGIGLMSVELESGIERSVFTFAAEGILNFQPNPGFRLSRDGKSLVYAAYRKTASGSDETVLRIKELGRPARDLVVGLLGLGDWIADESAVLFTRPVANSRNQALWMVPASGGDAHPLGLELLGLRDVSAHPDGQRIAFTTGFPGSELWRLDKFLIDP
jgi:WD40 repeat protein